LTTLDIKLEFDLGPKLELELFMHQNACSQKEQNKIIIISKQRKHI
jgi:hypothetical protein